MTKVLQDAVVRMADYRANYVIPNYTPDSWWECDVFVCTKAGYFTEYEIKVSLADFARDKDKSRTRCEKPPPHPEGLWQPPVRIEETKHELIAAGDRCAPSRFWYVTPPDLIPAGRLPSWAGLMEAVMHDDKFSHLKTVVKAPKLHKEKFGDNRFQSALCNAYHRYCTERETAKHLSRRLNDAAIAAAQ